MKKNLLIMMMALFSAGVLSAQEGSVGLFGFCGGANVDNDNHTTIVLGQAFAFQETGDDFEICAGLAQAQLNKELMDEVTLTPDQAYNSDLGYLTAPVAPGNYDIYHNYTVHFNYDSAWIWKINSLDCEGTVADCDGNEYEIVGVAGLCWTKSNLKPTKYCDDTDIPTALIYNLAPDNNEDANLEDFGRLYTWYSAVHVPENSNTDPELVDGYVQGICPDGWHIPTLEEMSKLLEKPAKELKEEGAQYWLTPNDNNNASNFSARGAGKAIIDGNPAFMTLRGFTDFWTVAKDESGQAQALELRHFCAEPKIETLNPGLGVSVRCVRTENVTAAEEDQLIEPVHIDAPDADGE